MITQPKADMQKHRDIERATIDAQRKWALNRMKAIVRWEMRAGTWDELNAGVN